MDFVVLEMVRELQKLDTENEYLIFVNHGPDNTCLEPTANFKIVVFGGAYPYWEQVALRRKVKQLKLDVLHCTSNTAPIGLKERLIVTIHDIIYYEHHPLKTKGYSSYQVLGNLYRRFVVKRLLPNVDKIITVSHYEKKRMQKVLQIESNRLEVIYNGVGKHFKPLTDVHELNRIKEVYALPERFVLFLGNTDPKKNTKNTILAFAKYCKTQPQLTHKMVVGDLQPQLVQQMLGASGLEEFFDAFHFTGYIANQDMPGLLTLAEIFLYPSKRESFGIPLLESMACGKVVITGDTSAMPEIAGDAAYLVNAKSQSEISQGIDTLLRDEALRETLIARGHERVKLFSWRQTAEAAQQLYIQQSTHA